jgi:hypothetical protein
MGPGGLPGFHVHIGHAIVRVLLYFASVFTDPRLGFSGNSKKPNSSIAAATPLRVGFHAAIGMEGIVFGTLVYYRCYHRIEHRTSHKDLSPGLCFPRAREYYHRRRSQRGNTLFR